MKNVFQIIGMVVLVHYGNVIGMPRGKSKELKRIDDHQTREMAQSRIRDLSLYWFQQNQRNILQKQWAQQEHNQNMRPMCDGHSAHRIRITLNSTCVKNLEKATNDLIALARSQVQNAQSSHKWIDDHKKKEMVHSSNQLYYHWYCGQRKAKNLEEKPINICQLLDQPQLPLPTTSKEKRYQFQQSYLHKQKQCAQQECMHNKKNKKLPISQKRMQVSHRAKR